MKESYLPTLLQMRLGVIESQLQGKFHVPTVFLYPGMRTGKTRLKFLGFYPEDGNYRSVHVGGCWKRNLLASYRTTMAWTRTRAPWRSWPACAISTTRSAKPPASCATPWPTTRPVAT